MLRTICKPFVFMPGGGMLHYHQLPPINPPRLLICGAVAAASRQAAPLYSIHTKVSISKANISNVLGTTFLKIPRVTHYTKRGERWIIELFSPHSSLWLPSAAVTIVPNKQCWRALAQKSPALIVKSQCRTFPLSTG